MKRSFLFLFTSLIALSAPAAPLRVGILLNFLNSPTVTPPLPTKDVRVITYDGQRVKKTVAPTGGSPVVTIYIGDIEEITAGQVTNHIFAGGQRIASKTGATILYFHQDHLGSTSLITNSAGAVVQTTKYLPFGNTWSSIGSLTDINFTGHRLDISDGLIYARARYYDPSTGKFVTPDTIVQNPYDPQFLNRYTYCRNNPINLVDPSGHASKKDDYPKLNRDGVWELEPLVIVAPRYRHYPSANELWGKDTPSWGNYVTYNAAIAERLRREARPPNTAGYNNMMGQGFSQRVGGWSLNVAEWSEASSYVANGVAMGSLLFGPEAAPVYGGASLVAAGLDITATAGYWTHYALSDQKASLFKGFSSFLSVPLDAVPMFKPGVSLKQLPGAVSYIQTYGARWGYIPKWYGTLRIAASDVTKISIQETAGYLGDHNPGENRKWI